MDTIEPLPFKYKLLNARGEEAGVFSKRGELTADEIVLDKTRIPLLAVAQTAVRMNRLILVVATGDQRLVTTAVAITSGASRGSRQARARAIKQAIDRICSASWADRHRDQLRQQGRAAEFHAEDCPYCGATIDLSGFDPSPQVYCPYCQVVATLGPDAPPDEAAYRLCNACGYYSRPSAFTSTYIVFLCAAVIWRLRTTTRCNACMRSEALKMLLVNTPFVIGIPWTAVALTRAYFGGSTLSAAFAGLDAANYAARKKKWRKAEDLYDRILERMPHAAGVRYNRALLRLGQEDWPGCLEEVKTLWADCANYQPAVGLACKALNRLGRQDKARALELRWSQ